MVRGSSLESGTNYTSKTRPKLYSGGIKDWKESDRILVKSYLHSEGLLPVVLHGVAPKASRTTTPSSSSFIGAGTKQPQFNTPTALPGVPLEDLDILRRPCQEYLEDLDIPHSRSSCRTPPS